jgi:alkylation response protein AidB-like acyl-CoA dehydrogenase
MEGVTAFLGMIDDLGRQFEKNAEAHDAEDSFVAENFSALREKKVFSALIPEDLGGGGFSHHTIGQALRKLSRYCSSTALSLAMHQHLIGFQTYNHLHGKPGRKVLEMVAQKQIILVSTGANDWLTSSGYLEKVEGAIGSRPARPSPAVHRWVTCS